MGNDEILKQTILKLKNKELSRSEAKHILDKMRGKGSKGEKSPKSNDGDHPEGQDRIAVVGISLQAPGATNKDEFWNNLERGIVGTQELTSKYLDLTTQFDPTQQQEKTYCKWGGMLEERDCFDPLFFNISPWEAHAMNANQRLVLQECWKSLEDAGYNPKQFDGEKVGVFIGAEPTNYFHGSFTGTSDAIVASRLSYSLNIKGPAIAINTGCSSSGVAIHLACESIRNGECPLALAGGVFGNLDADIMIALSQVGLVSPTGKCRTFDAQADGTLFSEGVGIVVLKPLQQAISDKDNIYGVIEGSGVNQDGKSNGITAPNGASQQELMTDVYRRFNIDPEKISLFEAHGTATKLGDPIEVNALVRTFKQYTSKKNFCYLGSAKATIGHTSAAAGVLGLSKVLLSMKNRKIPKLPHFNKLNPLIELEGSAFQIPEETVIWEHEPDRPRMASLNSFGHSGTNSHLVISEYIAQPSTTAKDSPVAKQQDYLIPLSATTEEALSTYADKLLYFLENEAIESELPNIAYTMQLGRPDLEERVVFLGKDITSMAKHIRLFLEGEKGSVSTFYKRNIDEEDPKPIAKIKLEDKALRETSKTWYAKGEIHKIAEKWSLGHRIYWESLYPSKLQKMSLPVYPFAKGQFGRNNNKTLMAGKEDAAKLSVSTLHPLVHINTSDFHKQRFSSTFSGEEFFFRDHVINGEKVLPGVAYLEMARAALHRALGDSAKNLQFSLREVIWAQPIRATQATTQVHMDLLFESENVISFEVYSEEKQSEKTIHSKGTAVIGDIATVPPLNIEAYKTSFLEGHIDKATVYNAYDDIGIAYGDAHQSIEEIHLGQSSILTKLTLPSVVSDTLNDYMLHPSLLDGALQSIMGLNLKKGAKDPSLPFALEKMDMYQPCTSTMWVHASHKSENETNGKIQKYDLNLYNDTGALCFQLSGFTSRTLKIGNTDHACLLLSPYWKQKAISVQREEAVNDLSSTLLLCGMPAGKAAEVDVQTPASLEVLEVGEYPGDTATAYVHFAKAAFEAVRKVLQGDLSNRGVFQIMVPAEMPWSKGLSGLLKTAQMENPEFRGQIIEIDKPAQSKIAEIALSNRYNYGDKVLRYENNQCWVQQWDGEECDLKQNKSIAWKDDEVYLVTGGAGGLGKIFAKDIVSKVNSTTVILVGRSALDQHKVDELESLSTTKSLVVYRQLDITDESAILQFLNRTQQEFGAVNGIIHAAGIIKDDYILKKDIEEIPQVLAPKVQGLVNLDKATANLPLRFFTVFSSITASFGNPGQSDYAMANAFADYYADYRDGLVSAGTRSGKTLSIAWPLWKNGGMIASGLTSEMLFKSTGTHMMATQIGVEALNFGLGTGKAHLLPVEGNIQQIRSLLLTAPTIGNGAGNGQKIEEEIEAPVEDKDKAAPEFAKQIELYVKDKISEGIDLPVEQLNVSKSMETYGIDSIMVMKLTTLFEEDLGTLPKTLFFEYQTIRELSAYFKKKHHAKFKKILSGHAGGDTAAIAEKPASPIADKVSGREKAPVTLGSRFSLPAKSAERAPMEPMEPIESGIAIVGLAGRYPQANNVHEFWENLKNGKDCITEVPKDRWDHAKYNYSKWGGFIEGVKEFDPLFFNISPQEASFMDPQERLFLQTAYETMEDAGYTPSTVAEQGNVGVYVGVMYGEYQLYGVQETFEGRTKALASSASSIANRVSYFCNFHGPCMAVDTMCSSSLTTVHLACEAIYRGECDAAIAGGVNVSVHPNKYQLLYQGKFESSKGRCESFGEGGDGYVPGEGVGAVLLKPTAKAIADGDKIYGIIKGSAVNHGGKTNGYSVPNPKAQAAVINRAFEQSGINPRTLSYVEAHGTGTSLGDPIEIAGLDSTFGEYTDDKQFCAIGSAKSNIGHCESAAGIGGITKILLQLKHKQLAPSLHSETLNPNIDFANSPFYVQQTLTEWKKPVSNHEGETKTYPRLAGISSFGAGGSNAHLLIEEFEALPIESSTPTIDRLASGIILLSAKDEEKLKERAEQLIEWLKENNVTDELYASMAYTLQVGRQPLEQRLAIIANDRESLSAALKSYLSDNSDVADVHQGRVNPHRKGLPNFDSEEEEWEKGLELLRSHQLRVALEFWCIGLDVPWNALYTADTRPQRVHLPTYPFAKEVYWAAEENISIVQDKYKSRDVAVLHPLLHKNKSTFSEQRFCSTFTGEEFFLADHVIKGQKILPGAAYLEIVRAAITEASEGLLSEPSILILENVVWTAPLFSDKDLVNLEVKLVPEAQGIISYEVASTPSTPEGQSITHSRGKAKFTPATDRQAQQIGPIKERCNQAQIEAENCYKAFDEVGMNYGKTHQCIETLYIGKDESLAKLRLPDSRMATLDEYFLHPGIIDAVFQANIGLLVDWSAKAEAPLDPMMPFAMKKMEIHAGCTSEMWAHTTYTNKRQQTGGLLQVDIALYDVQGQPVASISGLSCRAAKENTPITANSTVATESGIASKNFLLTPVWEPVRIEEHLTSAPKSSNKLVIGQESHMPEALKIDFQGVAYLQVHADDTVETIVEKLDGSDGINEIVWMASDKGIDSVLDNRLITEQECSLLPCFRFIKALIKTGHTRETIYWTVITQQGQAIYQNDTVDPTSAGLFGLIGTMVREYPKWNARLIDLEKGKSWHTVINELPFDSTGNAWVYRGNQWYRPKMTPLTSIQKERQNYKKGGLYVVLGGSGGIGETWSEYMVKNYNAQIVWIGRRNRNKEIETKLDRIEVFGPRPHYIAADATDITMMQKAHQEIQALYGAVNGVVHSALLLKDSALSNMTEEDFSSSLRIKVDASVHIAEVFNSESLDFILFFSSMNSFAKSPGQSNYAAGCTFQDAYAYQLNREIAADIKLVNWGYWGSVGVVASDDYRERMERIGLGSIEPEEGMEVLEQLCGGQYGQLGFIKLSKQLAKEWLGLVHESPEPISKENTVRENVPVISEPSKHRPSHRDQSETVSVGVEQLLDRGIAKVKELVSDSLKIPLKKLDAAEPLEKYGLDSILVVQLSDELEKVFSGLSSTIFFEYQTIEALVEYLVDEEPDTMKNWLGLQDTTEQEKVLSSVGDKGSRQLSTLKMENVRFSPSENSVSATLPEAGSSSENEDIAIIGLSGRYPQAIDLEVFWENLKVGKNCISEVPSMRWDWRKYYDEEKGKQGYIYSKYGGFMEDVSCFDPYFFQISPMDAELMDPQERLFLEIAYACIEDAGYTPENLSGNRKVGVYTGVMNSNYPTGTRFWSIPNRVSYLFDFQGPSMAIDTACSSSLTAIHLAIESLRKGTSEVAIAGGVNVIAGPNHYIGLSAGMMLSSGNQCKSFGDGADGFVDGEGVGAVLLKPKSKAIADGDNIYGIIKGSSLNAGGKTNGFTVPNPITQARLIKETLRNAKVNAREISYIEAHGTGTALGDPIEINGLTRAFKEDTNEKQYCAIGSLKSNIGHCESAAGIGALTKVLLQMKHKKIVPSLHSKDPNPKIDFENTPFAVQQELSDWAKPTIEQQGSTKEIPRIAGISSFGAGGASAHLIIEEYNKESTVPITDAGVQPVIIVLSAKSMDRLEAQARQLYKAMEKSHFQNGDLADIAYTLQKGRRQMNTRLAFVADSISTVKENLHSFLQTGEGTNLLHFGQASDHEDMISDFVNDKVLMNTVITKWVGDKLYDKLIAMWVKGLNFNWDKLYDARPVPNKISLPTYPFEKEHYWMTELPMPAQKATIIDNDNGTHFDEAYYEDLFDDVASGRLTVEAAVLKGPRV